MLAGPSEILIIADDGADPKYLAADLLSQAEHDPLASAILAVSYTHLDVYKRQDAGLLGSHNMFGDYLKRFEARDLRRALIDLFKVLDTPEDLRDPYLDAELAAFPYVNGGLFADENIDVYKRQRC